MEWWGSWAVSASRHSGDEYSERMSARELDGLPISQRVSAANAISPTIREPRRFECLVPARCRQDRRSGSVLRKTSHNVHSRRRRLRGKQRIRPRRRWNRLRENMKGLRGGNLRTPSRLSAVRLFASDAIVITVETRAVARVTPAERSGTGSPNLGTVAEIDRHRDVGTGQPARLCRCVPNERDRRRPHRLRFKRCDCKFGTPQPEDVADATPLRLVRRHAPSCLDGHPVTEVSALVLRYR